MALYLMKYTGEIIKTSNFNALRKILKKRLDKDEYVRDMIKGVRP